jgi:hypothetical protein
MLMVIPNEGKQLWLYYVLSSDGSDVEDFVVDLFSSNTTVVDASTGADFTIATFSGYAQVSVPRTDFGSTSIVSNVAQIDDTTPPAFTCSGGSPQTVYGWIMRGAVSGTIYAGQNFDTPRVMSGGASETLTPFRFKLKTFT